MTTPLATVTADRVITDLEKARTYRERMIDAIERAQAVLSDAQKDGMVINVGPFGVDSFGRPQPVQCSVHKALA